MNRRDFLSRFLQTAAGAAVIHTLDLDKLLWVPGERTIFLPSAPPLSASEIIAQEWAKAIKSIPELFGASRVYFINPDTTRLFDMRTGVHSKLADHLEPMTTKGTVGGIVRTIEPLHRKQ